MQVAKIMLGGRLGQTNTGDEKMKTIALISGGIDSAVAAYIVHSDIGLTFYYGQRHKKEIEHAKMICDSLGIRQDVVDISSVYAKSPVALVNKDGIITGAGSTVIPLRNLIFLSVAASAATSIDADSTLVFGANLDDVDDYSDCRLGFVYQLSVIIHDLGYNVKISTPLSHKTKVDVIRAGARLGVPFELTWSCYEGREKHCGVCPACRLRITSFLKAGVSDPTEYEVV